MARGERLPLAANYSVAVLLAVVAQLTRLPLHSPTLIPYITYAPFILLAAFRGGLGPGLLATILCTVESLYYATEPVETFRVQDPQHWLGLGALALTGVVASLLFGRLKEARIAAVAGDQVRGALALELEARRRMLESVIEHSPVSIALLRGRDFRFETVNPAYQALAPGEPMAGRTVVEVWPEAAPVVVPLLEEVRDHRNVYHATALAVPLHRGPGLAPEERYFDFTYVPLPGTSSDKDLREVQPDQVALPFRHRKGISEVLGVELALIDGLRRGVRRRSVNFGARVVHATDQIRIGTKPATGMSLPQMTRMGSDKRTVSFEEAGVGSAG